MLYATTQSEPCFYEPVPCHRRVHTQKSAADCSFALLSKDIIAFPLVVALPCLYLAAGELGWGVERGQCREWGGKPEMAVTLPECVCVSAHVNV